MVGQRQPSPSQHDVISSFNLGMYIRGEWDILIEQSDLLPRSNDGMTIEISPATAELCALALLVYTNRGEHDIASELFFGRNFEEEEIDYEFYSQLPYVPFLYSLAYYYYTRANFELSKKILQFITSSHSRTDIGADYYTLILMLEASIAADTGETYSHFLSQAKDSCLHEAETSRSSLLVVSTGFFLLYEAPDFFAEFLPSLMQEAHTDQAQLVFFTTRFIEAIVAVKAGTMPEASSLLIDAYSYFTKLRHVVRQADIISSRGISAFIQGNYLEALQMFFTAKEHTLSSSSLDKAMVSLVSISHIHRLIGSYSQAIEYAQEAYNLGNSLNLRSRLLDITILMSSIALNLKQYAQAESWLAQAEELASTLKVSVQGQQITSIKILLFREQGRIDEAIAIGLKSLSLSFSSSYDKVNRMLLVADILIKNAQFPQAKEMLEKALGESVCQEGSALYFRYYTTITTLYIATGNTDELEKSKQLLVGFAETAKKENRHTHLFRYLDAQLQIADYFENWKEAAVISKEMLFLQEKLAAERGDLILNATSLSFKLAQRAATAHLEKQITSEYKEKIQDIEAELQYLKTQLLEKDTLLQKISLQLPKLLDSPSSQVQTVTSSLLEDLRASSFIGANREAAVEQIKLFDNALARALLSEYPDLTPMELKICSLLKQRYTTKEVANLLHTSIRNIENHRYRIRKKLNLRTDENLVSLLTRLVEEK